MTASVKHLLIISLFVLFYSGYHSRDVNAKLNLLGLGKSSSVHKLDPNRAEELATALMGEVFTYIIFATLVYAEYSYVAKGSEIKEQQKKEEWNRMERRIEDITMITEKQEAEIMELRRILQTLEERNHSLAKKFFRKEKNG